MSIHTSISIESGLLTAIARGDFSLEEAKRSFLKVLESVVENAVVMVLYDGRAVAGEIKTIERFAYGEFIAKSVLDCMGRGLPRAPRFAYVLGESLLDPYKLGENTAANRGMVIKAFENFEKALAWLGLPRTNRRS